MKTLETLKDAAWTIVGILAFCAVIYFMYWIFKSGSYFFFYESMVQDTIREMVKAGSLK